ncbi:type I glyceraldehyde-3-phosphate dehydrogenase [Desulfobotulus mexicanus]|uniref:Erythrose-4-phosphate dehydrogenase n=1 Tax=Desulfobotulus mexicanus TaxID=2586642 RepID=A0A5Q4VDK1_9BACT|nr:glyceraldehyde 3-phosphate dehydrogenase NAD-binding domain-containing protein [Desulfobotulus mexicanus]TYT75043.1 erythrose-4-phosphate dehydrogenase [Desulfobotulus mexicanus]
MTIRIAINGYGRIGRCVLRALYESSGDRSLRIVAINEPADISVMAHLTRYDSTHGRFSGTVGFDEDALFVEDDIITVTRQSTIEGLPWGRLGVDLVMECTGHWISRQDAEAHKACGAKKVLFSCPAAPDVDATVVFGLNEKSLSGYETVVSNASCTTNCICHLIHALDQSLGIVSGVITTTHAMMNDQPVIDAYHHGDLRRTRSAGYSILPVETGLARGLDRIFPHLKGRFQAVSLRVPTMNVSLMQLTARVEKTVDREGVNVILKEAACKKPHVMGYGEDMLVSCDYNHDARSAIVDGTQTRVAGGHLVTVMAWFDNEWGYANRMLDTAAVLGQGTDPG